MTTVQPFVVRPAEGKPLPIVASIPHTGTRLPDDIGASLASAAMRAQPMTDWHLHDLYDFLPALGVTTVHAVYSRFVVDLNRAPRPVALYPGRFETSLVPTETFDGRRIFTTPPDAGQIESRRQQYHAPYHARLAALLDEAVGRFGHAVLFDLHSVASAGNRIHGPLAHDIFLGDRDGTSCPAAMTDHVARCFADRGFAVVRNDPYKGGYITDHYGRLPAVDALQIEMAQRVYMDEVNPAGAVAAPAFDAARRRLQAVFGAIVAGLA